MGWKGYNKARSEKVKGREYLEDMSSLSDLIEDYLRKLLMLSPRRYVDIQRGEVARKFDCVPSQINYVLNTRFTMERGYLVESRRGGRGYIRIYRADPVGKRSLKDLIDRLAGEGWDPRQAGAFLLRLREENILTWREAQILEVFLAEEHYTSCPDRRAVPELQRSLFLAVLQAALKGSDY